MDWKTPRPASLEDIWKPRTLPGQNSWKRQISTTHTKLHIFRILWRVQRLQSLVDKRKKNWNHRGRDFTERIPADAKSRRILFEQRCQQKPRGYISRGRENMGRDRVYYCSTKQRKRCEWNQLTTAWRSPSNSGHEEFQEFEVNPEMRRKARRPWISKTGNRGRPAKVMSRGRLVAVRLGHD